MKKELIAPCGMNCRISKAYSCEKNTCPGCRKINIKTSTTYFHCIIRDCTILKNRKWKYCSDTCDHYPCKRLKSLDKGYRIKYHMSMLENLTYLKEKGMDTFLEKEKQKWTCSKCDGLVTCHGGMCFKCELEKFKT